MASKDPSPRFEAAKIAELRSLLPTDLGTAELRSQIAAEVRANAVFSARATNAIFLSKVKEVVTAVSDGEMDLASARVALLETLKALGYTPEGGFPDAPPGSVPPAVKGTLQDLSSFRRLNLILETQRDLLRGRSLQIRHSTPTLLYRYPAWELIRVATVDAPRDWQARWKIASGQLVDGGRMIALKGDPIWGELGNSANFDDALDTDHPPFAFNSGMGWRPVRRQVALDLGITGPNGETIDEWMAQDHPLMTTRQRAIPAPVISLRDVDPKIRKRLEEDKAIAVEDDQATPADAREALRQRIAERRRRRASEREERMARALEKARAEIERRGQ